MARKLLFCTINAIFLLCLGFCFERRAQAYVDPGSGLLVLQSLGAILSGVVFYFRRKLLKLLPRSKAPTGE